MYKTSKGINVIRHDELHIIGQVINNKARSTCPCCRDVRTHGKDACLGINLSNGWGHCYKCGESFLLEEFVHSFNQQRQYMQGSSSGSWNKTGGSSGSSSSWNKTGSFGSFGSSGSPLPKTFTLPPTREFCEEFTSDILAYLKQRCISPATAHKLGVKCITKSGPRSSIVKNWLAFPYMEGTQCINVQYKSIDKEFHSESGCELILYNINSLAGSKIAYITEGMMDTLAMVECGYDTCISVPNGAQSDMRAFDCFKTIFDGLDRIIFAGDTDKAGLELRNKVGRHLGEGVCEYVDWTYHDAQNPERDYRAKDCNEMLMARGPEGVKYCIEHAFEAPIEGVVTLRDVEKELDEFYNHGIPDGASINLQGFAHLVKFKLGCLHVFTAYPGQGKSTFVDYVMLQLMCLEKWKVGIFSPEKYPISQHYHELITTITGKPCNKSKLSQRAYQRAKNFVQKNIFEISGEGDNKIETILHAAEVLVKRHHIRLLVLDPFNYIQLPMISGANDTQKISEVLKSMIAFAHENNVQILLVTHPRKPSNDYGKQQRPTLSDINGSQDFANKADVGVVIQRCKVNCVINGMQGQREVTMIYNEKSRFSQLGQIGNIAVTYNKKNHRFYGCTEQKSSYGGNQDGDGKNTNIYHPLPFDDDDWLSDTGEQQTIHFEEDEGDETKKKNGNQRGNLRGNQNDNQRGNQNDNQNENDNTPNYGPDDDAMPF